VFYFRVPRQADRASRQHRVMSSSRVRFSLHISAHRGEERRKGGTGSQESKEIQGI